MKISLDVDEAVVEKLWAEHLLMIKAESNEWKKVRLTIWSKQEVIVASTTTILDYYTQGKLIYADSIFVMLDRGFIVGVYSTLAKAQEGYRREVVTWKKHVDYHWIATTSSGDVIEILQKTAQ